MHYSVSINGAEVDSTMVPSINITSLKTLGLQTFTGINGVRNTILDTQTQETAVASQSAHTLVLNTPLAVTTEAQFQTLVQKVWSDVLGELEGRK